MEANWIVIGAIIIIGLTLIIYLIRKNQEDEKEVVNYFKEESSTFLEEDEPELNDDK